MESSTHIYEYILSPYKHLIALCTASHRAGNQDAELGKVGAVSCELIETQCAEGRWHCAGQTIGMKSQTFMGLYISQGRGNLSTELVVV